MGPDGEHIDLFLAARSCKLSGCDVYMFGRIHVRAPFGIMVRISWPKRYCIRYWQNIPDPFLGPKGVRPLLLLRGLTG